LKISLNWLKEYIDLSDISVEQIVAALTMSGLEVEDVINEREKYKDFIVGFVKEKNKHPNADKLYICTVSTGKEDLQVICGATNVDVNQKVVFAPIGTLIPKGNSKITKAKIRGVESFGMICAEDELELSDDHSGIMILDDRLKVGEPITEALALNDVVMEIAITPNRPDALSHIGVARDLAALFNREIVLPKVELKESSEKITNLVSIEIEDSINCPRYSASAVLNLKIKESPLWLQERLTKIGLRPINNVVDVTNYVMYETGQPLHAFDLDKISGKKIVVKSTKQESSFTTLDSKLRKLLPNTLMICDSERPIALAGIMGGENSEISNDTKNILIESAHFSPSSIRRTSKYLGLSTEASYRFERWVDPSSTLFVVQRAAQLISEMSNGEIAKGYIDVYPNKILEKEVSLRFNRVKKILGYEIPEQEIQRILTKLGCKLLVESKEEVRFLIPTFRSDLEREIDLIEEVARIYGYNNIPTVDRIAVTLGAKIDQTEFADKIKTLANALGFYEMINNPLQSEHLASILGNKIPLLNPQSVDMAYLRTTLIPGALATIAKNINVGEKNLFLFEIGNVFNKKEDVTEIKSFDDFTEEQKALFIMTGRMSEKSWHSSEKFVDFYSLKGMAESLFEKISLDNVILDSYYHGENPIYNYFFAKHIDKKQICIGGSIKKSVLKEFDIQQEVFCFELDLDYIKNLKRVPKKYTELLKFPKAVRDFAFIFDKSTSYQDVIDFIKKSTSKFLKSVSLFDLFESDNLGKDKKSMAFSLEYYDENRTLTEEEVEKEFLSLISLIENKFHAKLRGN
jgi:phenylalanyl-tRNA synthetase beta chain